MTKRRRILHADKIIQNVIHMFCLLMFLQLKGYYSLANNPVLLYSTTSDIRVANLSKLAKTNIIVKGLKQGSAVDFIHTKNLICWSDQTAELIQCMNYNETHSGEKMRIVSEGLITPIGIAIDWYTDKIYWTDGETNRIEVISIEQKHRKVLFWSEVDLARAIAVVPKEGLLFWTDWGEEPKIERAGMNGDPKTRKIIVKDNIIWPNGITVDYNNNLIYWVDAKLHFIDVIDFNGEERKRIVKGGLEYPYAITIFNEKFYWTDWTNWAIHSWDMATNGPIKELIKSDPVPVDIKVYDGSRQLIPPGDYPCKINNSGCSHLCLLSPSAPGYTCACPTGTALAAGSLVSCHARPQAMLLVAQRSVISRISLDSPDYTPYTLPLRDLKRALTVDFDPKTEFIYWADNLAKTISRARLDGSSQAVVVRSSGAPDGVAVDPLARNLYWTDPVQDTISVARLDGSSVKVLIHEDLYDPRAIALHPAAGWMFWSDWSERRPRIERAALDGSARAPLVADRLAWPNAIALHHATHTVYWADARTRKIEAIGMDGKNRREVHGTDIQHIFGLALLDGRLYWTDMQRRTLDSIDEDTGADRQPVVEQLANMMGLKAIRLGAELAPSRCSEGNGGCSHLCFNRPADRVCGCPLGLELGADLATCAEPEAFLVYARKNEIGHVGLGLPASHAVLPIRDLKEVSALEVDVSGSKIYWADSKTRTISRCPVTGGGPERLLDGLAADGLAIDWSAQNLYWTDAGLGRLELARLDGSSRRVLLWQGLRKPKAIALDPRQGYMYWSETGARCIKRAGTDGSGARVLVEAAGRAHALALDAHAHALYWAALEPPALHSLRLGVGGGGGGGGERRQLAAAAPMPTALALHARTLYWGDWNTGQISAMNQSDASARRVVASQLDYVTELKVFHRARAAAGRCGVDNGGCQHLCLPAPAHAPAPAVAYRCACPTHYRLEPDNLTCSEPEEFLLFAQKNAVGRIVVANGECNDASIPIVGLKNIKAIDYDPQKKMLYWIEEESSSIRRVPMSHAPTSVAEAAAVAEAGAGARPQYLALDVLGRALYWTALGADSINATAIDANANANASAVIVRGHGMQPRQLAVHQTQRVLVWADAGLGAIVRANVDGSDRRELARAHNATALALDQPAGLVYWACERQILAVDLDARTRRVVWQGGWVGTLAAYGGALYLSGGERALMRLPLQRPNAPAALVPHVARLHASAVVRAVPRSHPCYGGRACGGGAGACLEGGACGCAGGCAPRRACAPHTHLCAPDARQPGLRPHCIPAHWRCDGQVDCSDGSDEGPGCGTCAGGVRCVGGACAAALAGCGAGAPCPRRPLPDAFRCDDKLCLSPGLLCDGRQHCEDGSDEAPTLCTQKDQVPTAGARAFPMDG